jgi:hypothetical protein
MKNGTRALFREHLRRQRHDRANARQTWNDEVRTLRSKLEALAAVADSRRQLLLPIYLEPERRDECAP